MFYISFVILFNDLNQLGMTNIKKKASERGGREGESGLYKQQGGVIRWNVLCQQNLVTAVNISVGGSATRAITVHSVSSG